MNIEKLKCNIGSFGRFVILQKIISISKAKNEKITSLKKEVNYE